MSNEAWYVGLNGQQQGPMTTGQIVAQIQAGAVTPQHYVFTQGMESWTQITHVGAFGAYFGGGGVMAPPPMPAPAPGAAADEIDYQIFGEDLQFVEITLDPNEACIAEAGAMMFMEPGIEMETVFGDGTTKSETNKPGLMGSLVTAGKRVLTGESLFMTVFGNVDPNARRTVAFAAPYPGTILPMDLKEIGGKLICQKDAFLCAARGVTVGIELQRKLGVGLFGGEGFILQKLEGDGLAFVHAGGVLVSRELEAGETLRIDTGCVVAFQPTVGYDIQLQKGVKSILFGGEGLFLATLTGPGKVWMQSLPFSRLASRVWSAAPQAGGNSVGEGSLAGGLGNLIMGGNR